MPVRRAFKGRASRASRHAANRPGSSQQGLPRVEPGAIISQVSRDSLKAFGRQTLAFNRQPYRLAAMPFQLIALALATYGAWTGDPSGDLVLVTCGIGLFSILLPSVWLF